MLRKDAEKFESRFSSFLLEDSVTVVCETQGNLVAGITSSNLCHSDK
jgi:hypothetical protein